MQMTTENSAKNYDVDDISSCTKKALRPHQIKDLDILTGVSLTWIYQHWRDLGGVVIGNKKFILLEKLYAVLEGNEREVLHKDQGTDTRQSEVLKTCRSGHGTKKLEQQERGKGSRGGAETASAGEVFPDLKDDPWDLASAL